MKFKAPFCECQNNFQQAELQKLESPETHREQGRIRDLSRGNGQRFAYLEVFAGLVGTSPVACAASDLSGDD
jgi:hypothetical protein